MRDLFRKTPTFVPIRATEIESLMEVREGRVPSRGLSAGAGRHVDKLALFQNQSCKVPTIACKHACRITGKLKLGTFLKLSDSVHVYEHVEACPFGGCWRLRF